MDAYRYIVDATGPFRGQIESATYLLNETEYVMYSGSLYNKNGNTDLPLSDYLELRTDKFLTVLTGDEMDALMAEYHSSLVGPVRVIDYDTYWEALEVLPPKRWKRENGIESFFMREHYTGPMTNQYATRGDVYLAKMVDMTQPETWITPADFDAVKGGES